MLCFGTPDNFDGVWFSSHVILDELIFFLNIWFVLVPLTILVVCLVVSFDEIGNFLFASSRYSTFHKMSLKKFIKKLFRNIEK